MTIEAVSLPFREQAEFFRRKLNFRTEAWHDIYAQEHNWSFMVAGANRDALVADFRRAVEKVISDGATLEDFRLQFDSIVNKHGWSYRGGRNWRSRVIYDTNLNTSYMAGRYQQLLRLRNVRPYWQYLHSDAVEHPRPDHLSWHGMVLRWDDPWWQYYFPTNGWGCQCRVIALSEDDLKRMGKRGPDTAPTIEWVEHEIGRNSPSGSRIVRVPRGIDPGFEYIPGGDSRIDNAIPPAGGTGTPSSIGAPGISVGSPKDTLPAARSVPVDSILPDDIQPATAISKFLAEFGASMSKPALFRDVAGESLAIGRALFFDKNDKLKLIGQRPQHIMLMADTIKRPDEIWLAQEWHKEKQAVVTRRRYIARWEIGGADKPTPILVVFEWGADAWDGVTAYNVRSQTYLDRRIRGVNGAVRIYRREERPRAAPRDPLRPVGDPERG